MANSDKGIAPYREMTWAAVILGVIQGVVMTMAFVYAGLKLGFTLPGSTIAAIMGFALLKGVLKRGTIVENNINQTIASGVNIASAGIVFTLPVLFLMMKDFNPLYAAISAIAGSFLGVAVIIPLRKQMIDFDRLRFPSGTAVASILKSPGAGREKAMLLAIGFLCSAAVVVFKKVGWIHEEIALAGFPEYTQTAIYISLMNLGAGMLAGRGGLPFFFGGCLAFWIVAPVGVHLGFSEGVAAADLTGHVYSSWVRPLGIGMLIGGALMGVVMAFPSIKSALQSLAKASKTRGEGSHDELSVKVIGGGFIAAFILLFLGAWLGVEDDTWRFAKASFHKDQFRPFVAELTDDQATAAHKQIFASFSEATQQQATTKLREFIDYQQQERQQLANADAVVDKRLAKKQKKELDNYWRKLQQAIIGELNILTCSPDFANRFAQETFSADVEEMRNKHQQQPLAGVDLEKLNRCILIELCPQFIMAVKDEGSKEIGILRALIIAAVATIWLALAGIIVAQCTGVTDISPLSGLSLIAVTIILALSSNSIFAAVLLGVAVCVATAQCADMMQDLKTGYLVGGIPKKQQYGQIAVAWLGPLVAIITLYILNQGTGFGPGTDLPAPQAGALQAMIQGVVGGNVPVDKYVCGGVLGGLLSLLPGGGIGVLVGLAMYLPFAITLGYGIGCFVTMGISKLKGSAWTEDKIVPLAAGFIVGEAMTELGYSLYVMWQG